ncbi:hypothetical protein LSAT2_029969 [Lamellibrachia satsuma]|nr:hypothetical protein LSAT2_029969 [Lamellibrachia satsuma]
MFMVLLFNFSSKNDMKYMYVLLTLAAVALCVAGGGWEHDEDYEGCLKRCDEHYEICMKKCKSMSSMLEFTCKRNLQFCQMACRIKHSTGPDE